MNAVKGIFAVVLAAIVLAIVAPAVVFAWRLSNTWTAENTGQLLGGGLAICGGAGAVLAAFVGAGAFAKLAGWRAPRHDDGPRVIDVTPAAPQLPAVPPWGVTGGGAYDVLQLPAPEQDARYRMEIPTAQEQPTRGKR